MRSPDRRSYWLDAFTLKGSVTPHVTPIVATFGILSMGICSVSWLAERTVADRWFEATVLPQLHVLAWGNKRGV